MIVELNADKLFGRLDELAFILGVDIKDMIDNEVRLFSLAVMRVTPPLRNKSSDGSYDSTSAKQAGEKAVERDVRSLFTGIEEFEFSNIASEYGMSDINIWRTMSDGRHVNMIWYKMDWSGSGMYPFHQKNRTARGRVAVSNQSFSATNKTWKARYVVTKQVLADYVEKAKRNVGRMRNGWVPGLRYVAPTQSVAKWVGNHSKPPGFVADHSSTGIVSLVTGNTAPGITEVENALRRALDMRFAALGKRVQRALSGYCEDIKTGQRMQAKSTKTDY